jgi:hypothetical protein
MRQIQDDSHLAPLAPPGFLAVLSSSAVSVAREAEARQSVLRMRNQRLGSVPLAIAIAAAAALGAPRTASAEAPSPELMARLADYATRLDSMRTHASYRFDGELSTLDRKGNPDSRKVMKGRIDADGSVARLTVLSYTDDGEDKTQDAQQKAIDSEKRKRDKPRVRLPILADEQPRYRFDQVETDAADPSRVKITFVPKDPGSDTIEGSAWVDVRTGSLLSAGFKLSKPSTFVDYVHFTVAFDESTPIGPAVSTVHVEGQSGFFLFHKRFQGTARVYGYSIVP